MMAYLLQSLEHRHCEIERRAWNAYCRLLMRARHYAVGSPTDLRLMARAVIHRQRARKFSAYLSTIYDQPKPATRPRPKKPLRRADLPGQMLLF